MWEFIGAGLVTIAAVVFGWFLNQWTTRRERKAAWAEQLKVRRAQVLADLTLVLESYELSDEAIEERDTKEARIHHFKHWRDRVFPIERELGTLVFLEPDEDARHKAEETARSLARVVYRLDVKITQTWQIDPYIDDALTDLRNAVNELDGFWRDS